MVMFPKTAHRLPGSAVEPVDSRGHQQMPMATMLPPHDWRLVTYGPFPEDPQF